MEQSIIIAYFYLYFGDSLSFLQLNTIPDSDALDTYPNLHHGRCGCNGFYEHLSHFNHQCGPAGH